MHVLISGSSGFIGARLATALLEHGHSIFQCTPMPRLGETIDSTLLEGCGVVVHAAWCLDPAALAMNVNGTISLAKAARAAGAKRQLFISSYSAWEDAPSSYGRGKWLAEQWFLDQGMQVVRPALVIGPGGLFARICKAMRRSPLTPLIDGGLSPTPVIDINDVILSLVKCVDMDGPIEINLAVDAPSMVEFLKEIRRASGCKTWLVSVPGGPIIWASRIIGLLSIRLPITEENIKGYRMNGIRSRVSHIKSFVENATSWNRSVGVSCRAISKELKEGIHD